MKALVHLCAALCTLLLLIRTSSVEANGVDFSSAVDTRIFEEAPDVDFSAYPELSVDAEDKSFGETQGLLKFDLSGVTGTGVSAKLRLWYVIQNSMPFLLGIDKNHDELTSTALD